MPASSFAQDDKVLTVGISVWTGYPGETTEAFCDGHVSGFSFFGGVPRSILYDNTRIAVARILGDGKRQRTRVFSELRSHYLFEDRFGRPGKGNDKGKVEGIVGYYLVRLTELELIDRERRMVERRIRMAKFPAVKSLDSFDFKAMPSLTLVTSNLPFDEWTEVFGSERLTGALLDRLTHHVHILEMNGDSYRLKPEPKTAETPNNLTTQPMVDPVGPQAPPTLLRFA